MNNIFESQLNYDSTNLGEVNVFLLHICLFSSSEQDDLHPYTITLCISTV